jgi:hypothetical protein
MICTEHEHRQPCPYCRADHWAGEHRTAPRPGCPHCPTIEPTPDAASAAANDLPETP